MPIAVDIAARIDKRSFESAKNELVKSAERAAQDAAQAFDKTWTSSLGKKSGGVGTKRVGEQLVKDAEKTGSLAAETFNKTFFTALGKQAGGKSGWEQVAKQAQDVYKESGNRAGDAFTKAAYDAMAKRQAGVGNFGKQLAKETDKAGSVAAKAFNTSFFAELGKRSGGTGDWAQIGGQAREIYARSGKEAGDAFTRAAYGAMGKGRVSGGGGSGGGFASGAFSETGGLIGEFRGVGGGAGKAFVAGAAAVIAGTALLELGRNAASLVAAGFKSVIDQGLDFSKGLNAIQGASSATGDQMKQVRAEANALGSDLTLVGTTASGAVNAMTALVKGGLDLDQAMTAARGTIQLATAAQIDEAAAAEIQAKALTMFNLKAGDATRVADVLAATTMAVPGTLNDTAQALENAGATAAAFGYSLEETVGILGTFIKGGLDGPEAGYALNTMMLALVNPSKEASTAIEVLGMKLRDTEGHLVGARDMIAQLSEAQGRLNPAEFEQAMAALFGTRGIRGAAIAGQQGVEIFDQLTGLFSKGGQAAQLAAANMQGLPGILEKMSNTASAVKGQFYDMGEAILVAGGESVSNSMSGLVDWINLHRSEIIQFFGDVATATIVMAEVAAGSAQSYVRFMATVALGLASLAKTAGGAMKAVGDTIGHVPDALLPPTLRAVKEFASEGGQSLTDFSKDAASFSVNMTVLGSGIDQIANQTLPQLKDTIASAVDKTAEAEEKNQKYRAGFVDLKDAIELVPETREVFINDNSEAVKQKLKDLGVTMKEMPDGRLKLNVEYRDAQSGALIPAMGGWFSKGAPDQDAPGGAPSTRGPMVPFQQPSDKGATSFDPSQWQVDSSFSGSGGSMTSMPGVSPGLENEPAVIKALNKITSDEESLEEARLRLLEVRADNTASQREILTAEHNVAQQERGLNESRMDLIKAQDGVLKDLDGSTRGMKSKLGVALDADLGLSRGLAGLADNLVRFLGNIAAAPALVALEAQKQTSMKQAGLSDSGSGLLGAILAPKPADTGVASAAAASSATTLGGSAAGYSGIPSAGGAPTEDQVKAIAASFGLKVTSEDRPGDDGYHGQGKALDISNGDKTGAELAFAQYMSETFGPNLLELIHDQPGWTGNIKNGKNTGAFGNVYTMDQAGYHGNHVHVAANWGQGEAGGAGAGPGGPGGSGFNWDAVAAKESSGNWQNNDTGQNGHYGGLQFSPSTWNAFGGQEFAPMPHQATAEQQKAIADRTAFTGYNGTPPQGLGAWEVITNGSTAADGITIASRPPAGGAATGGSAAAFGSGGASVGSLGGASFPIPLPVTIVGGAGVSAAAPSPASGSGGTSTGSAGAPGASWPSGGGVGSAPPPLAPPATSPFDPAPLPIGQPGPGASATPSLGAGAAAAPSLGTGAAAAPSLGVPHAPGMPPALGAPGPAPGPTPAPGAGAGSMPIPGQRGGPPAAFGGGSPDRTTLEGANRQSGEGVWQAQGGGFQGLGGLPMAAIQGAIGAGGMAGGMGGGQAGAALAQMATQMINRTIGFGGQAAGIGMEGIGETLFPNGSKLGDMSQNWLFRVAGGFAGAAPQIPSLAGDGGEKPGSDKDQKGIEDAIQKGFQGAQKQGGGDGQQPLVGSMQVGSSQDGQAMKAELQRVQNKANAYGAGSGR